tara:strand:- start:924 stop:1775 length:852 start_codon:yes stop_codon:yes gene_type:complete
MISIIICSRTQIISSDLSDNINKTIGCEYELIVIDNSQNNYSIFQAYNQGIKQSNGNYWCFMHDDILFHTQNWGTKIKEIFSNDAQIGLLGVAGAKLKTKMPSAWWDCPHKFMVTNIIHASVNNKKEKQYHGFDYGDNVEVATVDGVFMVIRANELIRFDERLMGFHNYDFNLAIQMVKQLLKVVVTNQILIEHSSIGNIDKTWITSALTFDKYHSNMLPLNPSKSLNNKEMKAIEFKNGMLFCEKLIQYQFKKKAIYYWLELLKLKPFSKFHYRFLKKWLLT